MFNLSTIRNVHVQGRDIKWKHYFVILNGSISKNEAKALKELQSDTSIIILQPDKDRATIILNHEDFFEKCIDHVSNDPY